ncbi:FixH family protein [Paenibacillus sp. NPDC057967]|uniref:FixH family protein n=1 Tax=Paenibacillus sp. NPDC057967 TaxID=3346293 RepID=UPI0036DC7683
MTKAVNSSDHTSPSSRRSWISWTLFFVTGIAVVAMIVLMLRPQAISADAAITVHSYNGGQLEWNIVDYPATVLASNTFQLKMSDASGNPLQGAQLDIKLEMISMVCGDFDFSLTETAPGLYSGEGVPLMPGLWKASLTIDGDRDAIVTRTLKAVYLSLPF